MYIYAITHIYIFGSNLPNGPYIYISIYIYIYTYIYTYIHTYIYTYIYISHTYLGATNPNGPQMGRRVQASQGFSLNFPKPEEAADYRAHLILQVPGVLITHVYNCSARPRARTRTNASEMTAVATG